MTFAFAALSVVAAAAPIQFTYAPSQNAHRALLRIVHIGRGGILTLDGTAVSISQLKDVAKTEIIYLQVDRGVTYAEAGSAMQELTKLPNHRIMLLTEDAKVTK